MNITIKPIDMRFFDREQEFEKIREIEELFHSIPRVELFLHITIKRN